VQASYGWGAVYDWLAEESSCCIWGKCEPSPQTCETGCRTILRVFVGNGQAGGCLQPPEIVKVIALRNHHIAARGNASHCW